jgi:peptidoglycan/xylan/chitin deacetylase (PgdA/CDA1 family)
MYHNILPEGEAPTGDVSLHLPVARFREQLDLLCRTHEVVDLESLLGKPRQDARRPRAVITFDDAYRGALQIGLQELSERDLPATIFVAPGFIGQPAFWWDLMNGPTGSLTPEARATAIQDYAGDQNLICDWMGWTDNNLPTVSPSLRPATFEELQEAATLPGVRLASHTWSHPNLCRVSEDRLARPLEWLRESFPNACIPWTSYPYGLFGPEIASRTAALGFRAAVKTRGGWLPGVPLDRFAIPRVDVASHLSIHGFALRSAGLFCP